MQVGGSNGAVQVEKGSIRAIASLILTAVVLMNILSQYQGSAPEHKKSDLSSI